MTLAKQFLMIFMLLSGWIYVFITHSEGRESRPRLDMVRPYVWVSALMFLLYFFLGVNGCLAP